MRTLMNLLPLAALAALVGARAGATTDAVHPQIRACATLKNGAERLACYDQAIDRLSTGAQAGAFAGADTEGAAAALSAEAMFGLESREARAAQAGAQDSRDELAAFKARVATLGTGKGGMRTIELDNGQVWRQLSAATNLLLQVGDEVTVSRAALNSFRITAPGGRAAKVTRVR